MRGQNAVGPASLSIGLEGRLLDLISDPRKGIAQGASLSGLCPVPSAAC